jgi:hypothetical protein
MTNPKEAGGWGREVSGQPVGTKDRTFGTREAFPRDVDEGFGRHARPDRGAPVKPSRQVGPKAADQSKAER